MVDITQKSNTLRKAIAEAVVLVSDMATIEAVEQRRVPKGDVFEFSRAAGLLAVKKTSDVIPDCHPLPVEYTAITHRIDGLSIVISVEVHTIYKTGVEVEAMHGAAVTALTIYDMLKPIDKGVSIGTVKLVSKSGGKSDKQVPEAADLHVRVIVCSDSVSSGNAVDGSGRAVVGKLGSWNIQTRKLEVVPDDVNTIQDQLRESESAGVDLLIYVGGTGVSPRDVTPEAVLPLLDREVPGIMEAARAYGQDRTPYAMLSRGVAGLKGKMLVITLPGSPKGALETLDAIFPQVLHVFKVADGTRH